MKIRTLAAAALAVAPLTGCSAAPEPDQSGLEYNSGPFSATSFSNCVNSGTREYYGPGDEVYVYPAGQRTYEFSNKDTRDSAPIDVVTKDNLSMSIEGIVTFSLNTDCKVLQAFHERIGIKYGAAVEDTDADGKDDDGGWNKMLGAYLRQPLDQAMDTAAKNYNWKDLYTNPAIKQQWATAVGQAVVKQVNAQAGGQYFCAATFTGKGNCGSLSLTLQQPKPPQNVLTALASAQASKEQAESQKQENVRVETEAEAIKRLVKILGPNGYILYKAIQDGKIKVVPVPSGGAINVGD